MSTAHASQTVKEALRAKLHRDIVPQLEQLVDAVPEELTDLSQAEQLLRDGALKAAQALLQGWSEVAQRSTTRPCCSICDLPMRHKGLKPITIASTVGDICCRRPRYRCEACGQECYPHDPSLRFQGHAVTLRLAKVVTRLWGPPGTGKTHTLGEQVAACLADPPRAHLGDFDHEPGDRCGGHRHRTLDEEVAG